MGIRVRLLMTVESIMGISIIDDGLITPEVGAWGKEKYRLVRLYADMFAI